MPTDPTHPAYPSQPLDSAGNLMQPCEGFSKREAFAMHIMTGFAIADVTAQEDAADAAVDAVKWADALIAALNEKRP